MQPIKKSAQEFHCHGVLATFVTCVAGAESILSSHTGTAHHQLEHEGCVVEVDARRLLTLLKSAGGDKFLISQHGHRQTLLEGFPLDSTVGSEEGHTSPH